MHFRVSRGELMEEINKQQKEDEMDIDFSKISDFAKKLFAQTKDLFLSSFSQETNHQHERQKDGDASDLSFDISKAASFVKKHSIIFLLVLILFIQFIPNYGFLPWGGMWMRLQVEDLTRFDGLARNAVENQLKSQVSSEVNSKYPNLPSDQKQKIINDLYSKGLQQESEKINSYIKAVAEDAKASYRYEQEGKKYTYMPDIDPYTFLRRTRNLVEKGHLGDEVKNGIEWDNHMLAPIGAQVEKSLHPYVLFAIYKIFTVFSPKMPLMQTATYFPLIFILLSMIPAFLLGRKFAGNIGGIFSATIIAIHPAIMGRTQWGHADTDAYNVLFPILSAWLFIECFEAKEIKQKIIYSLSLGLSLGIYSYIWSWWYIFDFILAAIAIYFAYLIFEFIIKSKIKTAELIKNQTIKNAVLSSILIILATGIFVSAILDFSSFIRSPIEPLGFRTIRDASHENLWPNVYTTVAELNPLNLNDAIKQINFYVFSISLIGLALLVFKKYQGEYKIHYAFFFILWLFAALYATTKGTRFLMLTTPAIAIGFGAASGLIYQFISSFAEKELKISKKIIAVIIIIIFSFALTDSIKLSKASVTDDLPLVNDAWWNLLNHIKENSNKNAIINSWWDFGHHFKYISNRAVTFDGASQNSPMAHWIGKVLLTSNEKEAAGILRMLDCGSNNAFEELYNQTNDSIESIKTLYDLFQLDKNDAREVLKRKIKEPEKVLQYTHCEPPEDFFITSDDMIGKSGVWAHFGSWNFEKAYIWTKLKNESREKAVQEMTEKFSYKKEEAEKLYDEAVSLQNENEANFWIAPWPSYISDVTSCTKTEEIISCQNGLRINGEGVPALVQVNLTKLEAKIILPTKNNAVLTPKYLQYFNEQKELVQKEISNSTIDAGVIIMPSGDDQLSNTIVPTSLLNSIFTRLYFLDGHGLKYFKLSNKQFQKFGGPIMAWKVDWNGTEANLISSLKEKEQIEIGANVKLNYIMWTKNGTQTNILDSSIADWKNKNITTEAKFSKNDNAVSVVIDPIQAQKQGLAKSLIGMKKGETKIIQLNPDEAYGENAINFPLGNQTIYFKIKVEKIK